MKYIKKYETLRHSPKFNPNDIVYAIFIVNTSLIEDKPYIVKEISEDNGDYYCTLKNDDSLLPHKPYNEIRFIPEYEYINKKFNI